MRTHSCGEIRRDHINQSVTLCGWATGKHQDAQTLTFELRDNTGHARIVLDSPNLIQALNQAEADCVEVIACIAGQVQMRPEGKVESNAPTGEVHVLVEQIDIIAPPPEKKASKQQPIADLLTGSFHKALLANIFEHEQSRAVRQHSPLGLAMLQLDQFSGALQEQSEAQEKILCTFSHMLLQRLRKSDFVFRYAEDTFLILLPDTSIERVQYLCEDIRTQVAGTAFLSMKKGAITISAGITTVLIKQPDMMEQALARTDKALQQAIANGKNRVDIFLSEFNS